MDCAHTLDELFLLFLVDLLPELDLLLFVCTSKVLLDLPEDLSVVFSDFSFLGFESFWLGIAITVEAVLLVYVICADVVCQCHYALINSMYNMNELSAVRLVLCTMATEPQSGARTRSQCVGKAYTVLQDKHSHPSVSLRANMVGRPSKYAALPLSGSQMRACPPSH